MPKSSRKQQRKDINQVLTFVQKNSNQNIDNIAKLCGFSRQKVWRIIKHLEENQIIWGYTAITDGMEKNLMHFIMLLKRSITPFEQSIQKEIIFEKLDDSLPSGVIIENISAIHGRYDALLTFYAPDLLTAKKVPDIIFKKLGKYIIEYVLCETIVPIRKQGFKNPRIKELIEYI